MNSRTSNYSKLTSVPPLTVRARRYLLPLILLGLAVHLILPQLASFEQSLLIINTMSIWAVTLAFIAQLFRFLSSGYLLQASAAIVHQRLSILRGSIITLAAFSIGLIAGGIVANAVATYHWVRIKGVNAEGSGLAGTLPPLFNNGMLILTAVSGLIYLLIIHQLSTLQIISFTLILLVMILIIVGIIWSYHNRPKFTSLTIWTASGWARIRHRSYKRITTEDTIEQLFNACASMRNGGWRGPSLAAVFNTFFDMFTLYLLFIAVGHSVSLGVLLTGYGLPLLLGKIAFFIPGGVGVVEGTMATLYDALGVPDPITVVVILTYRMLSFWIPTLLGFPLVAYLQRSGN